MPHSKATDLLQEFEVLDDSGGRNVLICVVSCCVTIACIAVKVSVEKVLHSVIYSI